MSGDVVLDREFELVGRNSATALFTRFVGPSNNDAERLQELARLTFPDLFQPGNSFPTAGVEHTIKYSLRRFWLDESKPSGDRFDAMVLLFWDDLSTKSVSEIISDDRNQWAVDFMRMCVTSYPPTENEMREHIYLETVYMRAVYELSRPPSDLD